MRPRRWLRVSLLGGLAVALLAAPAVAQMPDRPADARLTVQIGDHEPIARNGTGTVPVDVTYWNEQGGAGDRVDVHLTVQAPLADDTVDTRLQRQVVTFRPDPAGGSTRQRVNLTLRTAADAPDRVMVEVDAGAEDTLGTVQRPDNASWTGLVDIRGTGPSPSAGTPATASTGTTGPVAPWHVLDGPWWITSGVAVTGWTVGLALVAVVARPGDPRLLLGALPVAVVTFATSWLDPTGVQVRAALPAVVGALVGLVALHVGRRWGDAIGATYVASFVGVLVGSDLAAIWLGQVPPGHGLVVGGSGPADALVVAPLFALLYLGFCLATMAAVERLFPGEGWLIDPPDARPLGGPGKR